MEAIVLVSIAFIVILAVQSQVWHGSYMRETEKRFKDLEIYVMNLEERRAYESKQEGFVAFVRFLFLLSMTGSFLKGMWQSYLYKVRLTRKETINDYLYRSIKGE